MNRDSILFLGGGNFKGAPLRFLAAAGQRFYEWVGYFYKEGNALTHLLNVNTALFIRRAHEASLNLPPHPAPPAPPLAPPQARCSCSHLFRHRPHQLSCCGAAGSESAQTRSGSGLFLVCFVFFLGLAASNIELSSIIWSLFVTVSALWLIPLKTGAANPDKIRGIINKLYLIWKLFRLIQ